MLDDLIVGGVVCIPAVNNANYLSCKGESRSLIFGRVFLFLLFLCLLEIGTFRPSILCLDIFYT